MSSSSTTNPCAKPRGTKSWRLFCAVSSTATCLPNVGLPAQNKRQLLVPRGFAHGFVVLEDDTIFAYKVDNYYSPENDRGVLFSDEALNIEWQVAHDELNLSAKDKLQPKLADTNDIFDYGVNYYSTPRVLPRQGSQRD